MHATIARPAKSPARMCQPHSRISQPMMAGPSANVAETDRSNSPEIIRAVTPSDTIPTEEVSAATELIRSADVKKPTSLDGWYSKTRNRRTTASSGANSSRPHTR